MLFCDDVEDNVGLGPVSNEVRLDAFLPFFIEFAGILRDISARNYLQGMKGQKDYKIVRVNKIQIIFLKSKFPGLFTIISRWPDKFLGYTTTR